VTSAADRLQTIRFALERNTADFDQDAMSFTYVFDADVEWLLRIAETALAVSRTYDWRIQKFKATYAQHIDLFDALGGSVNLPGYRDHRDALNPPA
jgi:hypothetical protein